MRTRNSVSDHYETVSMNNHKGSLKHCWVSILEKIIVSKSFGALSWNSCQRVGQIRFPDLIRLSQSKSNCTGSTPLVIQDSKRNSIKFLCHKSLCCSVTKFPWLSSHIKIEVSKFTKDVLRRDDWKCNENRNKKYDFPILWSIGGRLFILADLWLGIESGAQN